MEVILNNRSGVALNQDLLRMVAEDILTGEEVDSLAELSIVFVDPAEIRQLNLDYRGINSSTDVLAFPQSPDSSEGPHLLGDVVISPQIAEEQANKYRHSSEKEIVILLIHGILHLLGFDHDTAEERSAMEKREKEILTRLLMETSIK